MPLSNKVKKDNCWSEQSPEKLTILTVPVFSGPPGIEFCTNKWEQPNDCKMLSLLRKATSQCFYFFFFNQVAELKGKLQKQVAVPMATSGQSNCLAYVETEQILGWVLCWRATEHECVVTTPVLYQRIPSLFMPSWMYNICSCDNCSNDKH